MKLRPASERLSASASGGAGTPPELTAFARHRTALLTTYKRDGTPVGTPVTIALAGSRAFVRTYDRAGKAKRMRNRPDVRIAPSTVRGKPLGSEVPARSRLLAGDEAVEAARAIARRQPVLQGVVVPLFHRLARYTTLHYELTPYADG
ncbi:MAG: PPOX class F420-dependent oxidoreductase [Actinobacteria bacterium]|nr:MAG: PPOX class F420-dependent oxidoreductase [Actinomycetota bacterium]